MQTVLIIVLIVLIVSLLVILYFDDYKDLIVYFLLAIVVISIGIGFNLNDTYTVKKPMTPSLEIKCNNGKCDTSYVYKINR